MAASFVLPMGELSPDPLAGFEGALRGGGKFDRDRRIGEMGRKKRGKEMTEKRTLPSTLPPANKFLVTA